MNRWDTTAFRVAALPRERFRDTYHAAGAADRSELLRMRLRWRVSEFADFLIRPIVERAGQRWFADCDFQRQVYSVLPLRASDRTGVRQRLVLGPRGVSKTTTARIRAFHSMIYGLDGLQLAIAYNDPMAMRWIEPLAKWVKQPGPNFRDLWPKLRVRHDQHRVEISDAGQRATMLAIGFTGGIRGANIDLVRPTQMFLDDVEAEENSRSEASRAATLEAIHGKVRNSVPMEAAGDVWWLQTPIGPSTGATRRIRNDPELAAWDLIRCPAVTRWPESPRWEEAKKIFLDIDGYSSAAQREQAVLAYYDLHREEMSAGAEVLDPERLPIERAYLTRWAVREIVWAKDFDVLPRALGDRLFDSTSWRRCRWSADRASLTTSGGRTLHLDEHRLKSAWDPSDGGDAGALAIGFRDTLGRVLVARIALMEGVKLTGQIVQVVRECARLRVSYLQFESNSLDSAGEAALRAEIARVEALTPGWRMTAAGRNTSENKTTRLVNLEPDITNGLVEFAEDITPAVCAQFDDFDPRRDDNADDAPDATQRLVEMLRDNATPTMGTWRRGT